MNLENDAPGADSAPVDDLRSQLTAAFESASSNDAPPDEPLSLDPPAGDDDPIAAEARAQRARDEKGRFARTEAERKADAAQATDPNAQAAKPAKADEAAAQPVAVRPPPGWSPAAKAAFEQLPQEVKESVARREDEVNKGFEKLKDYKGLETYAEQLKNSGVTLAQAFDQYQRAEKALQTNFPAGVVELCQIYKMHPGQLGQLLVQHFVPQGQARQPAPQGQASQQAQPQANFPPALVNEIQSLKQTINSLVGDQTARQRAQMASVVDSFFADPSNLYADNVAADILDLVSRDPTAKSDPQGALKRAYERAVWVNPETRDQLINERARANALKTAEAAKQARASTRSLVGSPVSGAPPAGAPASSLRDELLRNFRSAGGRV